MIKVLLIVLNIFLSSGVKKLLTGAGLGLVTFGISQAMFSTLLGYVQNNFGALGDIFWLIDLSGLDVALSYVVSGISIRLTMNAGKISLRKL